jgi:predicted CopG family antitoxin
MASKTISVTEEVYDILANEKLPDESFSETLTRLVKDRGMISEFAGAWADLTEEESASIERGMGEVRESANRRMLSR